MTKKDSQAGGQQKNENVEKSGEAGEWRNQGTLQFAAGQFQAAVDSFGKWVKNDPTSAEAWCNLGAAYHQLWQFHLAEDAYHRALAIEPRYRAAVINLALLLACTSRPSESVDLILSFFASEPRCARSCAALGDAWSAIGSPDEAVRWYERALQLNPADIDACHNLGIVLHGIGRLTDAENCYLRVLRLNHGYARSRANLGAIALLRGDLTRGWHEYEWRWQTGQIRKRNLMHPRWNGEAVDGKTVLVWAEQGLGDTIQFARYLRMVKERGARVVFECQGALMRLLGAARENPRTKEPKNQARARSADARLALGIDQLVVEGEALPEFDYQVPLMSLPLVFATELETIPTPIPYLRADQALVKLWQEKLTRIDGFQIGINWHGQGGKRDSKQRKVPLEMFETLASFPGVRLISLQKEESKVQRPMANVEGDMDATIIELGEIDTEHGAFMDTAAIMMNLDLVITSDTSVAHLAGALGVSVWVALPFVPDWRWLLDRSDSPWYPTMRLFRQKRLGDWAGVFEEIEAALRERVQGSKFKVQN